MISVNKTEWDITPLYNSDDDPKRKEDRENAKKLVEEFEKKWRTTDYTTNPENLAQALQEYATIRATAWREMFYWSLRQYTNKEDTIIKAKANKAKEYYVELSNKLKFFIIGLTKVPKESQEMLLNNELLKEYKHFLISLWDNADHLLSESVEQVLSLKSEITQSRWTSMLDTFIMREERELPDEEGNLKPHSYAEITSLLQSPNKEVRDAAAEALNEIILKYIDVAEHEINAIVKDKAINDKLRNYHRPDAARFAGDDIDEAVIDSLLHKVTSRYDLSKRYYEFKAKLLKLPQLEYHERNIPYGTIEEDYTYEDSVKLVHKVLTDLDQEFGDIFKSFVDNNQIDVFPKKGKAGGAFCTYNNINDPIYLLVNHTNNLNDVLTLAHEVGHGINNVLIAKHQNPLSFGSSKATAEVASTFMEDFVLDEILKKADDELKLAILMMKLNSDISSIIRQTACYKFEQELHEAIRAEGYLSKDQIGEIFKKHMSAYMGPAVEQSTGAENWWVHWPHIRRFFYVYSYASGLLISKALQRKVRENPAFITKVKEFLKAGSSTYPKDIFAAMDIDITDESFWESGLKEIEDLLNQTEALAKKLGKI